MNSPNEPRSSDETHEFPSNVSPLPGTKWNEDVGGGTTSGGGGGGGLEARIAKIEANVEHIQANIGDIKTDINDIKKDYNPSKLKFSIWTAAVTSLVVVIGVIFTLYTIVNDEMNLLDEKISSSHEVQNDINREIGRIGAVVDRLAADVNNMNEKSK